MAPGRWQRFALALMVASAAGAANAGELGSEPPAPIWTGIYVGAHGGAGWGDADIALKSFSGSGNSLDLKGAVGGFHGGYGFQAGPWYVGIEGDYTFADSDGSESASTSAGGLYTITAKVENELEYLASVRGRLGFAAGCWLVYGTAGIAWTDYKLGYSLNVAGLKLGYTIDEADTGFVFGGGVQAMVYPGIGARFDVLRYSFDDIEHQFGGYTLVVDADQTVARVGFDVNLSTFSGKN